MHASRYLNLKENQNVITSNFVSFKWDFIEIYLPSVDENEKLASQLSFSIFSNFMSFRSSDSEYTECDTSSEYSKKKKIYIFKKQ